ncbi:MAG: nucleotidyl transferase AbiEii/AbiGii toxin family protein [Proteobacteria bacterium]|nr:nucleotidyl transferase AbiEii/AbiGii toxin family protein [Pseudomonadota bacterium]
MRGRFKDSTMNPDFAAMLSELSAAGADFIVVGAFALAAHGNPRATGDIDIWVRPTRANAERVLAALRRFGAPLFDLTVEDLADEQTVFQIGMPPVRIDILAGIDGVSFDEAWARREMADLGSLRAPVLAVVDLIANKRAAGRPKDLVDVAWLEALPAYR